MRSTHIVSESKLKIGFVPQPSSENAGDVETAELKGKMALASLNENSVVSRLVEGMESYLGPDEKNL